MLCFILLIVTWVPCLLHYVLFIDWSCLCLWFWFTLYLVLCCCYCLCIPCFDQCLTWAPCVNSVSALSFVTMVIHCFYAPPLVCCLGDSLFPFTHWSLCCLNSLLFPLSCTVHCCVFHVCFGVAQSFSCFVYIFKLNKILHIGSTLSCPYSIVCSIVTKTE